MTGSIPDNKFCRAELTLLFRSGLHEATLTATWGSSAGQYIYRASAKDVG